MNATRHAELFDEMPLRMCFGNSAGPYLTNPRPAPRTRWGVFALGAGARTFPRSMGDNIRGGRDGRDSGDAVGRLTSDSAEVDVLIVGAGVAGLSCARALVAAGKSLRVIDRARGVGGRCATRRVDGQPVDHGVAFLHGDDPAFLELLGAVPSARVDGWPEVTEGAGTACQPRAFRAHEQRVAYVDGVNAFARFLAHDLDVRLETNVTRVVSAGSTLAVEAQQAGVDVRFSARDVVLALAGPQTLGLLKAMPASPQRDGACALLAMLPSVACLTVIAVYASENAPHWHMLYPESSQVLQLIAHDSSKRVSPKHTVLVLQARPAWSQTHLHDAPDDWAAEILREAARVVGPWAGQPLSHQAHRWSHARVGPESELAGPLVLHVNDGCRVGLVGELFAPGGGVQAAWRSGQMLARRLRSEVES